MTIALLTCMSRSQKAVENTQNIRHFLGRFLMAHGRGCGGDDEEEAVVAT